MSKWISLRVPDELYRRIEIRQEVRGEKFKAPIIIELLEAGFCKPAEDVPAVVAPVAEVLPPVRSAVLQIPGVVRGKDLFQGAEVEVEPEVALCGFRSYNDQDGEHYLCGKPEGHGIKHGDWVKA